MQQIITPSNTSTKIHSKIMSIFALLMLFGLIQSAHAKGEYIVCGPEVKEEVAKMLGTMLDVPAGKKMAMEADLYEQFQYCAQDSQPESKQYISNLDIAAHKCGAKVSHTGSLYYEEMSCCGYDPQRRQFACPVKIKQGFGFGSTPLPGSREYVLHCVADKNDVLMPVGMDSVHLSNEMHGNRPDWQFAVIANANKNLNIIQPMDGETRRARSILSWGFEPVSCDYKPIWGNALNYRIRLDQ